MALQPSPACAPSALRRNCQVGRRTPRPAPQTATARAVPPPPPQAWPPAHPPGCPRCPRPQSLRTARDKRMSREWRSVKATPPRCRPVAAPTLSLSHVPTGRTRAPSPSPSPGSWKTETRMGRAKNAHGYFCTAALVSFTACRHATATITPQRTRKSGMREVPTRQTSANVTRHRMQCEAKLFLVCFNFHHAHPHEQGLEDTEGLLCLHAQFKTG